MIFSSQRSRMYASLIALFVLLLPFVARAQSGPPAFFTYHADFANGDQFDKGFHYDASSATGGGMAQRDFVYPGHASVTASLGAASASADAFAIIDVQHLNRHCNEYYGCGNYVGGSTGGAVTVFVRGEAGTRFHLDYTRRSNVDASIVHSTNLTYASASTNGVGVTTGWPPPVSAHDSKTDHQVIDGTSSNSQPGYRVVYQGQVYTFAALIYHSASVRIQTDNEDDLTATVQAHETISASVNLVRQGQQPPVAVISGPPLIAANQSAHFDGDFDAHGNRLSYDPDGSIVEYKWTLQKSDGTTETKLGPKIDYSWDKPGGYTVTLTITDDDGQTGSASKTVIVSSTQPEIAVSPTNLKLHASPECGPLERLTIKNVGDAGSVLTGSVVSNDPQFVIALGSGDFSLQKGQSKQIQVGFSPNANTTGTVEGQLLVTSNDPSGHPVVVFLEGTVYDKRSPDRGKFGHFYYRDLSGDDIDIDPCWARSNITSVFLPAIGTVQCHVNAKQNFVAAFAKIGADPFLRQQIHTFDGLWVPRYQRQAPHLPQYLSNHSWGTAIDLNAATNPFGGQPTAENINLWNLAFRDTGFLWGADFSNPARSDPQHFEVIP